MDVVSEAPTSLRHLSAPKDLHAEMAADVLAGMLRTPKAIPSKYFYDAIGSKLFDEITRLPEYYLTRTETTILAEHADLIMDVARPAELVELGSGYSTKTRLLLEAMHRAGTGSTYVPIDISEDAIARATEMLRKDHRRLQIEGLVGDFLTDLPKIPPGPRRLVAFLGSTIGNLLPPARADFFQTVAQTLQPGDCFLLGADLVKDQDTMIAAYNDSAGVTARFTRNVLNVINRELDADFDIDKFLHVPWWNDEMSCMEAWLEATEDMHVHIGDLDLTVAIAKGEQIHTEVSCKFTAEGLRYELAEAGLTMTHWLTDPDEIYAVCLSSKSGSLL